MATTPPGQARAATSGRTHECAARGCDRALPRRLLMCRTHWFQVPADVRASIWLAYRPGQQADGGGPSRAYIDAVTEAIEAVARHGRRTP